MSANITPVRGHIYHKTSSLHRITQLKGGFSSTTLFECGKLCENSNAKHLTEKCGTEK